MTDESRLPRIVALCEQCGSPAQTLEYGECDGMLVATGIKGRRVFFLRPRDGLVQAFALGIRTLEMGLCRDIDMGADFCEGCQASYCFDHWRMMPKFVDGRWDCIEAQCPEGHVKCFELYG